MYGGKVSLFQTRKSKLIHRQLESIPKQSTDQPRKFEVKIDDFGGIFDSSGKMN